MAEIKKLDGKTMDIVEQNIEQLKELFPSVFSEGKVQFNKLEELLGNYVVDDEDHYNFTWHGKRKAGRLAQTPSTGTLRPSKDESVDWDNTENLFIEGDNLEVLKLLQKSYHRQIKMIYIDPPYNTGNDFVYEDDFKDGVKNYLEMTGQLDGEGKKMGTNSSAAGRYHTNWLNMMYPRLKLARNLLCDDGAIFISIDDNEHANLKKLCNDIFGEENFVADLVWKKRVSPANDSQWYSSDHEYVCVYAKAKEIWSPNKTQRTEKHDKYYKNTDNDHRGPWNSAAYTCNKSKSERPNLYYAIINPFTGEEVWPNENAVWAYSQETHQKHVEDNILYWGADGKSKAPRKKQFLTEAKPIVPRSVLDYKEVGSTQTATLESRALFEGAGFSYPKSIGLLKKLIYQATNENDVILDFFAGSCTTAHAAYEINSEDSLNRKFVMVQIPEEVESKSEAYKAGYFNISEIGKERIRRAGKKIKEENPDYNGDLGFKVFKLDSSNIKRWDADFDTLESDLMDAVDYLVKDRTDEDVLYELCLKLGLDLSIKIEEQTVAGKKLFILGRGYLVVCLDDAITMDLVNGIGALKEELAPEDGMRVVFKDDGFKDDVVKTNALQTLKRFGIDDIKSL